MERAEAKALEISTEWEHLDTGEPAERACFSRLSISANGHWLTEGIDELTNSAKTAPLLSAYHLAEWLTWNWWRLRWEPRRNSLNWSLAHSIASIGGGYVWPNVTIASDGERVALTAVPTPNENTTPFRYISNISSVMPAGQFVASIDEYVDRIIGRLEEMGNKDSNLHNIWSSVVAERQDKKIARIRQLEAYAGFEPDEMGKAVIQQLLDDSKHLGSAAVDELAAASSEESAPLSLEKVASQAKQLGFKGSKKDAIALKTKINAAGVAQQSSAWKVGASLASQLREQESLGRDPLSDPQLAELAGVEQRALTERTASQNISYALKKDGESLFVFRSKWHEGRRFELARIMGDRLWVGPGQNLFPATRSYTFRQKMQRSFAAEFLSPFEEIERQLSGDYSEEAQKEVAEHFQVSERTIKTTLANHGRIPREELEFDISAA